MEIITKYPAEILILLFLIVTFLQSGIDKVTDWRGNVHFIKHHFKFSPLKNLVPFLLAIILIVELIASFLMIYGIYEIYQISLNESSTGEVPFYALLGIELASLTLILLLIGQRLAKDFAGAASLAGYFIITIMGIVLLIN